MAELVREEIIEEEVIEETPAGPPSIRDTIEEAMGEVKEEATPAEETVSTPEVEATPEPLAAPTSWKKEDAEHFAALPRPVQEVVLRRESERDRGVQQRLEEATKLQRRYQDLDQVLEPHQTTLGLEGKTPAQLVREHLAAEELLRTNPVAGIQWFCHHYKVTPEQLVNGQANQPRVDPHVQSLMQEITQLKGYLANQHQRGQLQYTRTLKEEVDGYAQEKDSNGNLLHPHWEAVKEQLPDLIRLAKAKNPQAAPRTLLDEAYKKAIRLDDNVWTAQQKAEVDRQKAANQAKVNAARVASSGIAGAPSGNEKQAVPKDLRSVIEMAFDGRL